MCTVCTTSEFPEIYDHWSLQTQTHLFNGPFSGTTQVSRYQKGKTNLDFTEARDSEWHQLGRIQVCTSLQTDNHASTPPLSCFTGRMPFLSPNQQRQSTEGMVQLIGHYTVSQKKFTHMACYNFQMHEQILIIFWQRCC